MAAITDLFHAWLAGFFDGEGTIYIGRNRRGCQLRVEIAQCDEGILQRIKDVYGGSIYARPLRPPGRQAWSWVITSKAAGAFLSSVLPYLILKKERAELALQFQSQKRPGRVLTTTDREHELALAVAIMSKNGGSGPKRWQQ